MKRSIGALILLSMVFAIPFTCLAHVASNEEQTLMALDVCSPGSHVATDAAPAVAEPVFDASAFQPINYLMENRTFAQPFMLIFLIDKPPIV
jgi:hypothetical protein